MDFAATLDAETLRGARVGVLRGPFGVPPRVDPILDAALNTIRSAGAEVIDLGAMPGLNEVSGAEFEVMLYEFKDGLNAYLVSLGDSARVKSLAEVIAFNEAHRTEELPVFGQSLFHKAQAKGPLTEQAYLDARATCIQRMRTEGIDVLMEKHRLDTLVTISSGPAWLIDHVNGDAYTGTSSSAAAIAGYPSVTVPAGDVAGLPVGISFTGLAWNDARQLQFAADFEARTGARREPRFLPTVALP